MPKQEKPFYSDSSFYGIPTRQSRGCDNCRKAREGAIGQDLRIVDSAKRGGNARNVSGAKKVSPFQVILQSRRPMEPLVQGLASETEQ